MSILKQLLVIFGVCLGGEAVASALPFAFPAAVAAMIILFLLLSLNLVHTRKIAEVSDFLQKNMPLFFIPAGVNILADIGALSGTIVPFFLICLITMVVTFGVSALVVSLVIKLQGLEPGGAQ